MVHVSFCLDCEFDEIGGLHGSQFYLTETIKYGKFDNQIESNLLIKENFEEPYINEPVEPQVKVVKTPAPYSWLIIYIQSVSTTINCLYMTGMRVDLHCYLGLWLKIIVSLYV